MLCPECCNKISEVIDSRPHVGIGDKNFVRRRRQCVECGHRWTTYEKNSEVNIQKRPAWCPHRNCQPLQTANNVTCVGRLPTPISHDGINNTHRWCLRGADRNGGVLGLQVNVGDLWRFSLLFDTVREDDGKRPLLRGADG